MTEEPSHIWTVWNPEPAEEPVKKTFDEHWNIRFKYGEVYWGVITNKVYDDRHPFEDERKLIEDQFENKIDTFLFIQPRDDQSMYIRGTIKEILIDFPGWRECIKVPSYYGEIVRKDSSYKIPYWFLLTSIEEITKFEMGHIRKLCSFDKKKHGALGYPYPCLCNFSKRKTDQTLLDAKVIEWKNVSLRFANTEMVSITIKDTSIDGINFSFEKMGFEKQKSSEYKPVIPWFILLAFAKGNGSLDLDSIIQLSKRSGFYQLENITYFDYLKKQISDTKKRLLGFFNNGLEERYTFNENDEPFKCKRKRGIYKTLFEVGVSKEFYEQLNEYN